MATKTERFWDRERVLTFASMVVASWAWIITERLLIGIAIGITVQTILTVVYETLARRFGWQSLPYVDDFVLPFVDRFFPTATQEA